MTEDRLRRAALDYLARYDAGTERVRRCLHRHVQRRLARDRDAFGDADPARLIEQVLAGLVSAGLIDDRVYAGRRLSALMRRGDSCALARLKLLRDGVEPADIDAAAAQADDLGAAIALVRRRRLGPYRTASLRPAERRRDLARLGRAGFDGDTARQVVDAADPAILEEMESLRRKEA